MEPLNNNISFSGRPKVKKILPKAKENFKNFCQDVESPSYMCYFTPADDFCPSSIRELNKKLRFTREFRKSLLAEGGIPEYFRGFVGILKTFKVANCDEFAELMKIILRMNKVKKCDIFSLYAKRGNEPPRALDHCIVALNVKNNQNNKQKRVPFVPAKNVKIVDMWWQNGFVGNIKKAKKNYRIFGLKENEQLLLRPLNTLEPDNKSFERIRKEFPKLQFN